mgnify:FL=1|tara:strand:+ start:123 stop:668 length:546 start_codon:yes stop_codon:yes gene_type:complete
MIRLLVLVTFISLAFFGLMGSVDTQQQKLMLEMIDFIEKNSDYKYDGSPLPTVHTATSKHMCKVLFVGEPPDPCHIAGYYNDDTNEIFIADKPTEHMHLKGFRESVLMHELVHFMQKINGTYETVDCKQALEGPAFQIQDKYTKENDHIHEKNENDPLFALMASSCPNFSGAMGIELLGGG